jgi:hypothetical protein
VPVTVPDVAELLGLAAAEALDELELLAELESVDEPEPPVVGVLAAPVPLDVVRPRLVTDRGSTRPRTWR